MAKVKEIRILEPKIKEVKKEKVEEKKNEDEEELDEEFFDFNDGTEFIQERRGPNLRRVISQVQQGAGKNLEAKMVDVVADKSDEEDLKKKEFYKTNSSDFYGDKKNVYTGAGDKRNNGYDSSESGNKPADQENLKEKQKYAFEQRRDADPLQEKFGWHKKSPRTL